MPVHWYQHEQELVNVLKIGISRILPIHQNFTFICCIGELINWTRQLIIAFSLKPEQHNLVSICKEATDWLWHPPANSDDRLILHAGMRNVSVLYVTVHLIYEIGSFGWHCQKSAVAFEYRCEVNTIKNRYIMWRWGWEGSWVWGTFHNDRAACLIVTASEM